MANHNALTGTQLHEPKGVATAASGEVYVANGAGSGAWTPIGGLATLISEIHIHDNSTATVISTVDTPVQVTAGWAAGEINGLTFDTDHLVVPAGGGGSYIIAASASVQGNNNIDWSLRIGIDTGSGFVAHEHSHSNFRTAGGSDTKSVTTITLITLNAGDKIGLMIENMSDTSNPTITVANLIAEFKG